MDLWNFYYLSEVPYLRKLRFNVAPAKNLCQLNNYFTGQIFGCFIWNASPGDFSAFNFLIILFISQKVASLMLWGLWIRCYYVQFYLHLFRDRHLIDRIEFVCVILKTFLLELLPFLDCQGSAHEYYGMLGIINLSIQGNVWVSMILYWVELRFLILVIELGVRFVCFWDLGRCFCSLVMIAWLSLVYTC